MKLRVIDHLGKILASEDKARCYVSRVFVWAYTFIKYSNLDLLDFSCLLVIGN
jgi:hypothetical protein